jgi:AbrB family looped-hinge helix DNA binding protein
MSTFVAVQKRGTIALPPEIRTRLGLDKPGAQLEIVERDGEIVLRPYVAIPADQAWFWEPAWQAEERDVDTFVEAGQTTEFEDTASFTEHLEALDAT